MKLFIRCAAFEETTVFTSETGEGFSDATTRAEPTQEDFHGQPRIAGAGCIQSRRRKNQGVMIRWFLKGVNLWHQIVMQSTVGRALARDRKKYAK